MKEIKMCRNRLSDQFAEAIRSQEDQLFRPIGYPIRFYIIDDLETPIEQKTDRVTVSIGSRVRTDFVINRANRWEWDL
jgi:hypothetical protein